MTSGTSGSHASGIPPRHGQTTGCSALPAKPVKCKHLAPSCRKLDVTKLKSGDIRLALQQELASALSSDDTVQWLDFKTTVFNTAAKVIGYRKTHHKDWFDEQDSESRSPLDDMYEKHLIWMNDKSNSAKKSAYVQARAAAQKTHAAQKTQANERDLVVCNSRAVAACRRPSRHEGLL